MDSIYLIFIFFLGLCIGSFISVLVSRLGRRGGILKGRSECPNCGHKLGWQDLVPLFSYIMLEGRCRYCRKKISFTYPIIEIVTALALLLFTITHLEMGHLDFQSLTLTADSIILLIFKAIVLIVFVVLLFFDAKHFTLPDIIILPMILISLGIALTFWPYKFSNLFITSLALGGSFAIIYLVSKGAWVGFGDSKFLFLIGLIFGYPVGVLVLFSAIWIAALYGFSLLILKKATAKTPIPFGSFLAFTSLIALIFENELTEIIRYF